MDEKFKEYFDQGNQYYENKDFDKALESYNKALEIDNNNAELYKQIGNIYHANEKFEEAIKYHEKAIKVDSKYWPSYNNLGLIFKTYYKDYDKSLTYLEKAQELSLNEPMILNNLGNLYIELNRIEYEKDNENTKLSLHYNEKALECYKKCLDYDIENKFTHNYANLANTYYVAKNWQKAIENYVLALNYEKNTFAVNQSIARCYRNLGNLQKAQEYISKALELDPHHEDIIAEQLMIYHELNEYEKMLNYLNSLTIEQQNDLICIEMYCIAYNWLDQYDNSIDACNHLIKIKPDNSKFYSYRANSYFWKKDYLKAIADIKIAILLDHNKLEYHISLLQFYFHTKQYDELVNYVNTLPTHYLHNSQIYYYKGMANVEKEFYKKSIKNLELAIKLGCNKLACYTNLIWAYKKDNNYEKAIEYAEITLEKYPEDEWTKETLEEIKEEL